ncbi:MAG: signal peptidase II [Calditrichaeota bacterium]|nr:signal peptidase II [Calditrichota bacterium]
MEKRFNYLTMTGIIVFVLFLDQLTKYIIKTSMSLGESIPVLGNFFRITYVENPGMAFGVRIDNPILFTILSLGAAGLVFYYLFRLRNQGWLLQTALSLIAAGAIGNLLDRFIRGKVVDFLDFEFIDISIPSFNLIGFQFPGYSLTRWPVFNVADSVVTIGMIILIFYVLFIGDPLKNLTYPKSKNEAVET